MNHIKQLKELLETDVLLEIAENIKELETALTQEKKKKLLQENLEYMQQVKAYFDGVVVDINSEVLTEKQALDILEGLEDMRTENQEI